MTDQCDHAGSADDGDSPPALPRLTPLSSLRCNRRGHRWFPGGEPREFTPIRQICLRCNALHCTPPYGECLGGHLLADHYDEAGRTVPTKTCPWPR